MRCSVGALIKSWKVVPSVEAFLTYQVSTVVTGLDPEASTSSTLSRATLGKVPRMDKPRLTKVQIIILINLFLYLGFRCLCWTQTPSNASYNTKMSPEIDAIKTLIFIEVQG